MYASTGATLPTGPGWTFEPKYDGIRVIAVATAGEARLFTRNGNDKSRQFPEIAAALRALAARAGRSLVLDGEVVALDAGEPARFQALQSRMHVEDPRAVALHATQAPSALVAFDLLLDGDEPLIARPWRERRTRLERVLGRRGRGGKGGRLRLGHTEADGAALLARARDAGWEGILAKRTDATYAPGVRTRHWLKLKVEQRQEFVVGGYTEPRESRKHLGALLLGYYDRDGRFVYAGHTGGGFTHAGLADMARRLRPLARATSPFTEAIKTNAPAHWVRPEVVVEVKFSEWTADGRLRQPIFVGVRDDKPARDVRREPVARSGAA
ncbi:DNA polymerase LigD, ligase domain protein [Gemmatirosa kalamazoonensis]|uniref:DNA ligase (ATP) n=2 Tax=Gemmatirosa kalamazoonensis TaxID=861299 RepID=W0RM59_9BACT|nr:DNA polymerase LigD, ligase domain protein [Gemmatirosa kalamazoonensis]